MEDRKAVPKKNMFNDNPTHILGRGLFVWMLIIAAETVHGIARRFLLEPFIGDFNARQVSVFIGATIVLAITFVFVRWLKASRTSQFILVGVMWVVLTVGFEILLGRLAMGLSWERIASDYNVTEGGLLPFGLLVMLLAPVAFAKFLDEI